MESEENIDSQKRAFRLKAQKYEVDSNNFLCYKKKIKNFDDNSSSSDTESKKYQKNYLIIAIHRKIILFLKYPIKLMDIN